VQDFIVIVAVSADNPDSQSFFFFVFDNEIFLCPPVTSVSWTSTRTVFDDPDPNRCPTDPTEKLTNLV